MNEASAQPSKRSILAIIFLSPNEARLRAGWRLLIQILMMLVISIVISIAFAPLLFSVHGTVFFFLGQVAELIAFTASIFLARLFLDRRSIASMGLRLDRRVWKDILAGIGITFIMMALVFAAMSAAGWLTFEGFAWEAEPIQQVLGGTFGFLGIFILVGWNEELLSRGYHLQTLASGANLFWGVLLSSAVFGALHLGNPNATWVSAAGIFFAGLFLAYGYLRTGQLWLSIGLHIGWNFFEGVVFGFPVSGLDIYPLTRIQVQGPGMWTGGAFGPEAGLVILPALLTGAGLIFWHTRNRRAKGPDTTGSAGG
ncbi:MAG: CPBP family intramembrane metalloprotease domain-containing protein [Anaerolineae bacterium CG03_land_8_20_14_0_80_58_20]|nr:MAG: CPBP family intramembrane metalloprotease domain-containing protein [Anaerolineae bacterium CG03_land_8_20_14_0_80_58_20]